MKDFHRSASRLSDYCVISFILTQKQKHKCVLQWEQWKEGQRGEMCRSVGSAPTGARTERHQLVCMRKQILCHLRSASAKTAASPEGPWADTETTTHRSLQDSDGSAEPRMRPRMGLFHMCAGLARLGWTWQADLHSRDLNFHQNRATCLKVCL